MYSVFYERMNFLLNMHANYPSVFSADRIFISICTILWRFADFSVRNVRLCYRILHKISWLCIYKIIYGRRDIVRRLGYKIYAVDALGGQLEH